MTTMMICLLIAIVLPILSKAPLAIAQNRLGGYDNRHPRAQQDKLQGFGARAKAAHQNAFEALVMFAPALLAAVVTNNTGQQAQWLAIAFVIARVAYHILYLIDAHLLRSVVWGVGFISSVWLAVLAI